MKRELRRSLQFLVAGLALVLAGCSTTPEDTTLDVGLVNLRLANVANVAVPETVAVADVRVDNISPAEIQVTGSSYRFVLNGRNLGGASTKAKVRIPPLGTALQTVEVHLGQSSPAKGLEQIARTGLVDYELEASVHVRTVDGRNRTVVLKRKGLLDLSRLSVPAAR